MGLSLKIHNFGRRLSELTLAKRYSISKIAVFCSALERTAVARFKFCQSLLGKKIKFPCLHIFLELLIPPLLV